LKGRIKLAITAEYVVSTGILPEDTNIRKFGKPVIQLSSDDIILNTFPSMSEAARQTCVSLTVISGICNCKPGYQFGHGYKFRFK